MLFLTNSSFIFIMFLLSLFPYAFMAKNYTFVLREIPSTKLCRTKKILTVNGEFPGPTLRVYRGETIYVNVHNRASENITLHWHGVEQPRNPWSDGPAYITQCPIQPGKNFNYKLIFSIEEGTIWWHAHSAWARATVHGAIFVYPKPEKAFPFPPPDHEFPIVLGEWWKEDVRKVQEALIRTGGEPQVADALTINGHPGFLYNCSRSDTSRLTVEKGKTYLLRMVNVAMNVILFFAIAQHNLTVVGGDGHYTKPLSSSFIAISPGQTLDILLHANQSPGGKYYMAARAYSTGFNVSFIKTMTAGILQYTSGKQSANKTSSFNPWPYLPNYTDITAAFGFLGQLRSLDTEDHPAAVPGNISRRIISTISINTLQCAKNNSCEGPDGRRFAASMNNISFGTPTIDILQAYYYHIKGVFGTRFPPFPPHVFNFTAESLPLVLEIPERGTEVTVLDFAEKVELVFQGTNLVSGIDHPMHLHGFSFYVVGYGFGNFDKSKHPLNYNLLDPPYRNTVTVPRNGWIAVRFIADNPGVWFMHCHLERHATWGMETVFIVKNGKQEKHKMLPPPSYMPPC